MAARSRIQVIEKYLDHPHQITNVNSESENISMFFASLLGDLFIQGYRVFETINSHTLILSLMQYSLNPPVSNNPVENLPQYKIVNFEMDVILDKTKRGQIFKNLLETAECIDSSVEVNIIYLKRQKFSVMNKRELEQSRQPDSKSFFKPAQFLPEKRGYKHIDVKTQGTRLHGSIEYFLKGNGMIRNFNAFKRDITGNQQQIKFQYDLNKVMNSLRMIIGKQVFSNDYWIMNSEKWMRKKTQKKFKRFDLILRNQKKICIIDWKFSKNKADQKINKRSFYKKNKLYLELAKKDYKAEVQLKFYCIHSQSVNDHYHKWTQASYDYKIAEVMLDNDEEEEHITDDSSGQIEFYDDRQTLERLNQRDNFIELSKTQEMSRQCLQEFKQKHKILQEKPKTQTGPKIQQNTVAAIDSLSFFSDEEYNPGKRLEIEKYISENDELRRGKRSKPVELIESEVRRAPLNLGNKKVKRNQNSLKDEVISISSKGQQEDQLDQIEILPSQLQSMELREKKKVRTQTLYFDPRGMEQVYQNQYLTFIERPSNVERVNPPNQNYAFENHRYNLQASYGGKQARQQENIDSNLQQFALSKKSLPWKQYDEDLLKCFEDEEQEERKTPAQIINENPQNPESPQIESKKPQMIIDQEDENRQDNNIAEMEVGKENEKKVSEKERVNSEALMKSYNKDVQNIRKKRLCNPKHYFLITDSDDQIL